MEKISSVKHPIVSQSMGANKISAPIPDPIYSPTSGGLSPKLYLYIVSELGKSGTREGSQRRKHLLNHLYISSLVSNSQYLAATTGDPFSLIPILGFCMESKISRLPRKFSDKKFSDIYDFILEDGIADSLGWVLGTFTHLKVIDSRVKTISQYRNGVLKSKREVKGGVKPAYLIAFIMQTWTCDYKVALNLIAALGALTNRVEHIEVERYAEERGQFAKLPDKMKSLFVDLTYIYYLKNSDNIGFKMSSWLKEIEGKTFDTGKLFKRRESLIILVEDFEMMSMRGKMICMRNLHRYEDGKLYVHMKKKQSYGNYGRQENVLSELSRSDRKCISTLYGFDMEAALQTILYYIFQPRGYELAYTYKYITNKNHTRENLMKETGYNKDAVKALITSIYQGKMWGGEAHKYITDILEDGNTLRYAIIDMDLDDTKHSKALQYAAHACKHSTKIGMTRLQYERSRKKQERINYKKSFMFFFWTYYERKAQDIISSYFSHPITLHDAVYTQDLDEHKDFDPREVEKHILRELRIPIKLDTA